MAKEWSLVINRQHRAAFRMCALGSDGLDLNTGSRTCCGTLGKLPNFSVPISLFAHLSRALHTMLLHERLSERTDVQCLTQSEY